ncbi:hypothetical protein E3T54_12570 [Cryobacterium sp. Sr8]|uniref:hypothetical protein n=1 Tax=Cryobacterium sp. Sr8 TaxID=1259203 RepID=UPI00106B5BC6|nr:hypothetical protein [Cryobacterium sp. Sr8]TFD75276.1 hypothetical protein E3T54_12570 [Cryobacterium sp. Sr8]
MNDTNRATNRILILVIGMITLAVGAGSILLGIAGPVRSGWRRAAPDVSQQIADTFAAATIPGTSSSWLSVAGVAVLIVLVVLLIVFILRQGNGRTRHLLRSEPGEHGGVAIDAAFAEQSLQNFLDTKPELVASHVSTYQVRNTPVLKVVVTCRRGVSPKDVGDVIDSSLASLDHLLGQHLSTFVQISGGFRARMTKSTRLQ